MGRRGREKNDVAGGTTRLSLARAAHVAGGARARADRAEAARGRELGRETALGRKGQAEKETGPRGKRGGQKAEGENRPGSKGGKPDFSWEFERRSLRARIRNSISRFSPGLN